MAKSTKDNHIPFYISIMGELITKEVNHIISFCNGDKMLKYKYICKIDDNNYAYFRSKEDAKMAANGNNWVFINANNNVQGNN